MFFSSSYIEASSIKGDYLVANDTKLSISEKLGYGMGDAACGIVYSSVTMFLTWFYTDIYGLSAAAVGVMFLVTRVLDAITDPLTGIVADRVKTRWGHFRPWLIWFAVPYAVLAVMTVPAIFESTGSVFSATVGFAAAVLLAYRGAALLPVALAACGVVFCTEWMMRLF